MRRYIHLIVGFLLVLTTTTSLRASIHLEYKSTAGGTWSTATSGFSINGSDITISSSPAGYWRVWVDNPSSTDLGAIEFVSGSNDVTLIVGKHSNSTFELDATSELETIGCRTLERITGTGMTLRVKVAVQQLGTTASYIDVTQIIRLDVNGDIKRPQFYHRSTTATLEAIRVGGEITDVDTDGPDNIVSYIKSGGGTIKRIEAEGTIACPIIVENAGELVHVESTDGDIGGARPATSEPYDNGGYQATKIVAGTIGAIIGQNVRSNISASVGVKLIESKEDGIRGNLVTPKLLNRSIFEGGLISAKDACNMNMTFEDELPANAKIVIGSFYGYDVANHNNSVPGYQPSISFTNADGLQGQIILNAALPSYPHTALGMSARRSFLGKVKVGTGGGQVEIAYPNTYAVADTSVGGGSLAVVGYNIHLESCDPPYSRSLANFPEFTTCPTITLRWYGPLETPSGVPLWITYTDGSSLVEVTSSFTISMDSSDPRQIIVTPIAPEELAPGMYWVSPNASTEYSYDFPYSHLYCRNSELGESANVPVAEDIYVFEITSGLLRGGSESEMTSPCIADANCDNSITTLDIPVFLELYFTANTTSATTECPGHTADANGDTVVDSADIAAFLSTWFARCN